MRSTTLPRTPCAAEAAEPTVRGSSERSSTRQQRLARCGRRERRHGPWQAVLWGAKRLSERPCRSELRAPPQCDTPVEHVAGALCAARRRRARRRRHLSMSALCGLAAAVSRLSGASPCEQARAALPAVASKRQHARPKRLHVAQQVLQGPLAWRVPLLRLRAHGAPRALAPATLGASI
jgi:hypothetical protein